MTRVSDERLFGGVYEGRRVLVTGHTGFKGSWLAAWLGHAGAEVIGYALEPKTDRDNFVVAGLEARLTESVIADVRDAARLREVMDRHQPEIVFHLAAQPLVRLSYDFPADTFEVNAVGTANLLDAVRGAGSAKATIVVTSDKCYRNNDWVWGYRETDALGGSDPYSASKAVQELVVSCYRDSYFSAAGMPLASVRAGNVIGGGDWSADRIVPDAVRALESGEAIGVRNPASTRPWQHVLEPLGGYMLLAARMLTRPEAHNEAFNFGPAQSEFRNVGDLCDLLIDRWGEGDWRQADQEGRVLRHEAGQLALDSSKARRELRWSPVLSFEDAVAWTVDWYRTRYEGGEVSAVVDVQIAEYEARASELWHAV